MNYVSSRIRKSLDARFRLTAMIVGALGVSTILYLAVGWFFSPAMPRGEYSWINNNTAVAVVLVAVVALIMIRRWLLLPSRLEAMAKLNPASVIGALHMASLSGAVLGDVVGISGVLASLLTGVREYSWRMGIAAFLMIAYSFPRRFEWEREIARAERAAEPTQNTGAAQVRPDSIRLGLDDPDS